MILSKWANRIFEINKKITINSNGLDSMIDSYVTAVRF